MTEQIVHQARVHGMDEAEELEKLSLTSQATKRLAESEEVGALAAWLIGEDSGLATGSSYVLDDGWVTQ